MLAGNLKVWFSAIALTGVLAIPVTAVGQQDGTGSIRGEVVGPEGAAVSDATVDVANASLRVITDEAGRFRVTDLTPGDHRLVIRYIGYEPDTVDVRVRSGETSQVAVRMEVAPVILSGLTVEGHLRGQARALNQQRTAANIRNVIAQEQIERFPDANIADGLKRVSGVTVSQDYGEARGVMIRGLPSALNSVTINGERVPSNTYGSRSVNLGNILSDMVESIEVQKALTPEMDADAIGGSVNLVTKSPTPEPTLSLSAAAGYNELRSRAQTDLGLTYGQSFGRVGIILSGSYLDSYRQEESLHYGWGDDLLRDFTLYNYQLNRERYGASGTVEYDLGGGSSLHARAMFNRFDDRQYTPKFTMSLRGGENLTSEGVMSAPSYRTGRQRNHRQEIVSLSAGGEHALSRMQVDYNVSYARGTFDQPLYFNAGWSSVADYAIDISDRNFPRVTPSNGTNPFNESEYTLSSFSIEDEEAADRDLTGGINFTLPFQTSSVVGAFKTGAKYRGKSNYRVAKEAAYIPRDGVVITMDDYLRSGFGNDDFYGSRYSFGPGYDPAGLSDYFEANREQFSEFVDREKIVDEYDAREGVAAVYGQADVTVGRFTMVGGVRYEHTDVSYDANEVLFGTDGEFLGNNPISQEKSYGGLYPSLHMVLRPTERTNLRAAVTRALSRPSYSSLAPYELVLHEDNEIERGNPELRPYQSVNYDLMVEHYLAGLGLISAGVFYKDLGEVIIDSQYMEDTGTYAGWEIVQPVNGTDATLWGWEASWQQQLTMLPGALGGLGIYANYSFTDSELNIPGAERKIAIPEQIPHAANVALLYERLGFSGNVSFNYQAGFIDDVGSSPEEDEYFGSRHQIDLSLSQRINASLRVYAEVNNLTDRPYQFYLGKEGRNRVPLENAVYGRWGTVGLRYDF